MSRNGIGVVSVACFNLTIHPFSFTLGCQTRVVLLCHAPRVPTGGKVSLWRSCGHTLFGGVVIATGCVRGRFVRDMEMFAVGSLDGSALVLLTLGGIFLLGVVTHRVGSWVPLPRISFLLLIGLALGPLGLDVLSPSGHHQWLAVPADIALVMVGFLLGGHFTLEAVRQHGQLVLWFSLAITIISVLVVFAGLLALGAPLEVAILLAGIATATDPAAVMDVIKETRSKGLFTQTLVGIVAIDDALGLIAFSVLLAFTSTLNGVAGWGHFMMSLWEVGGALMIGGGVGWIMARTLMYQYAEECPQQKDRLFMETLGFVLLCGGISIYLHVSFLLSSMMLGVMVVNTIPRRCVAVFHAIEGVIWPFLTLFFVFAGASLQPDSLPQIGMIGVGYVVFRIMGRVVGGWVGGQGAQATPGMRLWMGAALMPQAGIALGMALIAVQHFPHLRETVLPIVVGSTVFFQIVGPIMTRMALVRAKETGSLP